MPNLDMAGGILSGFLEAHNNERARKDQLAKDQQQNAGEAVKLLISSGRVKDYNQLMPLMDLAMGGQQAGAKGTRGKAGAPDPHQILSHFVNPALGGVEMMSDQDVTQRGIEAKQAEATAASQFDVQAKRDAANRMTAEGAPREQALRTVGLLPPLEKPIEVSPGASLVSPESGKPTYQAPFAPRTPVNPANLQKEDRIVPGMSGPQPLSYNPDTGKYLNERGNVVEGSTPYFKPTAVDPNLAALRQMDLRLKEMTMAAGGMTPASLAVEIRSDRAAWQQTIKPLMDRQVAVAKIDSGMAALKAGNRDAATQAIIVAFNRILDDNAVREGEYNRSEALAPYIDKIPAMITRLEHGGGSMTDNQIVQMAIAAQDINRRVQDTWAPKIEAERTGIEQSLKRYGIDPTEVFGATNIGKPRAGAPGATPPAANISNSAPAGGTHSIVVNGQTITFPDQAKLDAYKRAAKLP